MYSSFAIPWNIEDNDIIDIDVSENEIKEKSGKEASLVSNVDVDTCVDDDTNVQSDSSNQAEPSKMTPEELRAYMHRSGDNFSEVLFWMACLETSLAQTPPL